MAPQKRWYLLNGGNFDYSIEYAEEADERGMGQRGGYDDFPTFREAKKALMDKVRGDLSEARWRYKEARALKKKACL